MQRASLFERLRFSYTVAVLRQILSTALTGRQSADRVTDAVPHLRRALRG